MLFHEALKSETSSYNNNIFYQMLIKINNDHIYDEQNQSFEFQIHCIKYELYWQWWLLS